MNKKLLTILLLSTVSMSVIAIDESIYAIDKNSTYSKVTYSTSISPQFDPSRKDILDQLNNKELDEFNNLENFENVDKNFSTTPKDFEDFKIKYDFKTLRWMFKNEHNLLFTVHYKYKMENNKYYKNDVMKVSCPIIKSTYKEKGYYSKSTDKFLYMSLDDNKTIKTEVIYPGEIDTSWIKSVPIIPYSSKNASSQDYLKSLTELLCARIGLVEARKRLEKQRQDFREKESNKEIEDLWNKIDK